MADCHCFMPAPTKIRIVIAFAALYLIWGSTYLGIRFAIETIPPFLMAGTRFLIAGLIMYAIAWSQGIGKSSWANWRTSFIIGACFLLGGKGGIALFAYGETCRFSIFDRCSTDDLRRIAPVARRHRDSRDATVPSSLDVDLVDGFVCLFSDHRSCGWIYSLHLAVAPLRSGKSRDLCVRKSDRGGIPRRDFRRGNFEHAHFSRRRPYHRLSGDGDYRAAA